jgi:hypothetical protein
MTVTFIRNRRSYWGEPPLGCECGAILPIRADKVHAGSDVTCTNCKAIVTFDKADADAIATELSRLKMEAKKPEN